MWPFKRQKTIRGLTGRDQVKLSNDDLVSIDEIVAALKEHSKDIGVLTQACQRIERKQLRWLELLNGPAIKEESLPGVGSVILPTQPGGDGLRVLAVALPGEETEV